jgi:hypothetical protein
MTFGNFSLGTLCGVYIMKAWTHGMPDDSDSNQHILCVLAAMGELLGGAIAMTYTTGMQSMVAGLGASAMPDDSDSNQNILF